MDKKYKKLEKIYYSGLNSEKEYQNRLESPSSYVSNLMILAVSKKSRKEGKEIPLFYMNLLEHAKLQEEILQNSQKILKLSEKLPKLAIKFIFATVLVNEVLYNNQLEGIHSSKKELYYSLKQEGSEFRKQKKITGIIKKYEDIYSGDFQKTKEFSSVKQFRELYEELFYDLLEDENYQLDGKYFRKNVVSIQNSLGKVIHRGVSGEEKILMKLNDLLLFMNQKELPFLLKAAISHFFIEYVHPFYDGNGRFGRYIFSMYLARKLDQLSALSFSYAVHKRKEEYYKSFQEVENENNFGEITFFVENIYETVKVGQESILTLLRENVQKMEKIKGILQDWREKGEFTEKEINLLFLYMQDYSFNQFDAISNLEILECLKNTSHSMTKLTLDKYIKSLEEKGFLKQLKKRPLTYCLSDDVVERFDLQK